MRNQIDFSRIERITPREDSWDMVCARLDSSKKRKVLDFFQMRSMFAIAASFIAVAFIAAFTTFHKMDSETLLIKSVASDELVSWYNDLGESSDDELETLDNYTSISYLMKESK